MQQENPLARSFMFLCFGTAALMIMSQAMSVSFSSPAGTSSSFFPIFSRQTAQPEVAQAALIIDLGDRRVYLYQNGLLTASYDIAIGQEGWETPIGTFSVIQMQTNPTWRHPFTGELVPPGQENPLGSRWIEFWSDGQHQIGLHGTYEEGLIGQAVSHGCIRLRDRDVQALYTQVAIGTPVEVRP